MDATLVVVVAVVAATLHHHRNAISRYLQHALLRHLSAAAALTATYVALACPPWGPGGPPLGLALAGATALYLRATRRVQHGRRRATRRT